jgi:hypothetical protein
MALFGGFSLKIFPFGNEIALFLLLLGNKIFCLFNRFIEIRINVAIWQ